MTQTTTNVGRAQIAHPDRGYDTLDGGVNLHAALAAAWTKVSDHLPSRWTGSITLANSASTSITHNFGLALTKLKIIAFSGGNQLSEAQRVANLTITQTDTNTISVQNISGGSYTFQLLILAWKASTTTSDIDLDTFNSLLANWDSAVTYSLGALVKDASGNIYVSLANSNLNNAVTDGTKWSQFSVGGGGSGEKNYITNPSAASNINGWAESGSGTLARHTTIADLPRGNTTGTGFSFTSSADEDYAYTRFTLDAVDNGKKLKAVIAYVAATANFRVEVWKNSASNYGGTYTELTLSTDSSGDSYLPATSGVYPTTFDTDNTDWLELRIVHNGTGTDTIYFSDVLVGPGVLSSVPAIDDNIAFSPTLNNVTLGSGSVVSYKAKRVSKHLHLQGYIQLGTGGSFTGTVSLTMPSGMNIDTTGLAGASSSTESYLGSGTAYDNSADAHYNVAAVYISSNSIRFFGAASGGVDTGVDATFPFTWAANDFLRFSCVIPISEWPNSVNVGQSEVEYAYNSGTWDATDSSSFAYGLMGGTISGDLTADRKKRVRFSTPLLNGQIITILVKTSTGSYLPVGTQVISSSGDRPISNLTRLNSVLYGAGVQQVSATDFDIVFGRYANTNGATYGAAGDGWSVVSSGSWVAVKHFPSQALGFGEVIPGQLSGLVSANGLRGKTNGVAVGSGFVGEIVSASGLTNTTTATADTEVFITGSSITLTAGLWLLSWGATVSYNPGASLTLQNVSGRVRIFNETDATAVSGSAVFHAETMSSTTNPYPWLTGSILVNISSTKIYKIGMTCNRTSISTGADMTWRASDLAQFTGTDNDSFFRAVRIA